MARLRPHCVINRCGLSAADAIFPKQEAKTALPLVSPVPGRTRKYKQGFKHTLLTAAPACTLEIPKQRSEEEVWNAIRCMHYPAAPWHAGRSVCMPCLACEA